jgi:hypothetical protein
MTGADLERRIDRLNVLSLGLMRECALWEKADDPLLYLERRGYLDGIHQALAGVESARVFLTKACLRIREEAKQ